MTPPTVQSPVSITTGADGNLWFLNAGNATVGRITPSGVVTAFPVGTTGTLTDITAGPDGNLWFTDIDCGFPACAPGHHDSIGRITPAGVVTTFADYHLFFPQDITAGPDGNLWFTNSGGNTIGRITPSGTVSTFTGPGIDDPFGITAGPDGNVWFTNLGGSSIGRITPSGTVTNFSNPGIDRPREITAGGDGSLWFTNTGDGSIGRITTSGAVVIYSGAGIDEPVRHHQRCHRERVVHQRCRIHRPHHDHRAGVHLDRHRRRHPRALLRSPTDPTATSGSPTRTLDGAAAIGYVGTGLPASRPA